MQEARHVGVGGRQLPLHVMQHEMLTRSPVRVCMEPWQHPMHAATCSRPRYLAFSSTCLLVKTNIP